MQVGARERVGNPSLAFRDSAVIPPNGVYARPMLQEQLAAKRAGLGLRSAC